MWSAYPKTYMCRFSSHSEHFFHVQIHVFFPFFARGNAVNSQKFHILLILSGKMHWNGLSGAYLGFEVCQIQWHRFWVSMISGSWKIKIWGRNFTFCWFWVAKCIEIAWVACIQGSRCAKFNGTAFSLYDKWFVKNQNFRQTFHILLILTWKNALKWLEWHVFRVQGLPNAMAWVSSLYDKWFLKNQNFQRQVA